MQSYSTPGAFRDPTDLTRCLNGLLYASVVVGLVALCTQMMESAMFSNFQNGIFTSEEAALRRMDDNDARQGPVGLLQLLCEIASMVVFFMWIYRANVNARHLGAQHLQFTPGWAVGWFFIPVACLWKPYQAVKEIWQASANPRLWQDQRVHPSLPWWWAFNVGVMLLWMVGKPMIKRVMRGEGSLEELATLSKVALIADLIWIPEVMLLLIVVHQIHEMQMHWHRMGQDQAPPAPARSVFEIPMHESADQPILFNSVIEEQDPAPTARAGKLRKCLVRGCTNHWLLGSGVLLEATPTSRSAGGIELTEQDSKYGWICRSCWEYLCTGATGDSAIERNARAMHG